MLLIVYLFSCLKHLHPDINRVASYQAQVYKLSIPNNWAVLEVINFSACSFI
jgi:hypothetical protein